MARLARKLVGLYALVTLSACGVAVGDEELASRPQQKAEAPVTEQTATPSPESERTPSGDDGAASGAATGTTGDPAATGASAATGGMMPEAPKQPGFSVVVLGSSTAEGTGASSKAKSWVGLLSSALDAAVQGTFKLSNLAVGGYTTRDLAPGSSSNGSIDDAIAKKPDLIVIALTGSNDFLAGVSEATFFSNMTEIRDAAVAANIAIFFLGTAPKNLSDADQAKLVDWNGKLAMRFTSCAVPGTTTPYAPCFIDIYDRLVAPNGDINPIYNADGTHVKDAGHAQIFDAALAVIRPYVCAKTTCAP